MALQKQALTINFAKGLDTKNDPFQINVGSFLSLNNSIFDVNGRLTKRNGYAQLTSLPVDTYSYLTTFNSDLTAIGSDLAIYSAPSNTWVTKATLQPVSMSVQSAVKNGYDQIQVDSVTSTTGFTCVAYTAAAPGGNQYYVEVLDTASGVVILNPLPLPNASTQYGFPRVFQLSNYFIVIYTSGNSPYNLEYMRINVNNPNIYAGPFTIANTVTPSAQISFDAFVVNSTMYVAWNTQSGGQKIQITSIPSSTFTPAAPLDFSGEEAQFMTLTADLTIPTPIIYVTYFNSSNACGTLAVSQNLAVQFSPVLVFASAPQVVQLTSIAASTNNVLSGSSVMIFAENNESYPYDSSIRTDQIVGIPVSYNGTVGAGIVVARNVGIASKPIIYNDNMYLVAAQQSTFQNSYFLYQVPIPFASSYESTIISRFAYENGQGYNLMTVPAITLISDTIYVAYMYADLLKSINNTQGAFNAPAVFTQFGVNIASFEFLDNSFSTQNDISSIQLTSAEIGNNLNISGGFVTAYDGYSTTEQNFFLFPENIETTWSSTGGSMPAQPAGAGINTDAYFYQVTYEWTDNQGNIFRSTPSIPVSVTTTGSGTTGSVTLNIPTLRQTYKTTNPPNIVIYRWSVGNPVYYQVTSVTSPIVNDPTIDYITYVDTKSDASIIGNALIYTTGGVVEDTAPPATNLMTIFDTRLWLVDAEDPNLLWFSKQVIEATPVEFSDLFTIYVAPGTTEQGSIGHITAIAPMDTNLIIFKANSLGYISGAGPDNTGANSGYTNYAVVNATVGCTNQNSIVLIPGGLLFQSNKGIWLLGRNLASQYIGAPVEAYTKSATVQSAVNVPGTNQVRFTLNTGTTLMYDYYYQQWGVFVGVSAISSAVFNGLHTYINAYGGVYQESPGLYLDGSNPVLMSFTTAWINMGNLQGFERLYYFFLLGTYVTPFTLTGTLAYDYNSSGSQNITITPTQTSTTWGSGYTWGDQQSWGGMPVANGEAQGNIFQAQVYPQRQKCMSVQISLTEAYDSSQGVPAGQGFTLSGLTCILGMKKGYRTQSASRKYG